jgi:hypothetical protein
VSAFEELIQQLRSGVGDSRMLSKINATRHLYPKAHYAS